MGGTRILSYVKKIDTTQVTKKEALVAKIEIIEKKVKMGARISSGSNSKQTYITPREFLDKIDIRFGIPSFDLAATEDQAITNKYFTERDDSLQKDWSKLPGLLWLNPPFRNISKWAHKCLVEGMRGSNILLLVPASVGANWYRKFCFGRADTYFLNGRICFIPGQPFMKDLMVCHFNKSNTGSCFVWDWKRDELLQSSKIQQEAALVDKMYQKLFTTPYYQNPMFHDGF